ncbi:MAG: asparagine--tRNA ligase [Candidatus Zixiibacteriota bacterium]|nr:MAG: asparagine--tRNA ligase [candidate division Zixibacteria bacterium]
MDYFKKTKIAQILKQPDKPADNVIVLGWIRTRRDSANLIFLEVNDGSCLANLQIVIENPDNFVDMQRVHLGTSVRLEGPLIAVPDRKHKIEMHPHSLTIVGDCPTEYPLQKKRHSFEFLREIAHLRPRTNTFGVINRFRSKIAFAIHKFFQERGFYYIHSPIITTTDAEGAGETFKVTAFDLKNLPFIKDEIDFKQDFFGSETFLAVTGQLEAELLATAIGDVYTFGPTFRAENSNTSRHLSEFWMIEPEMAFCDLFENMRLTGEFLKYLLNYAINECREEMEFFNKWINKDRIKILKSVIDSKFTYCQYTEAVEILSKAKKEFEFPVKWGMDLQSEHERYLCEEYFKGPVMVYDYPRHIKPFYMRLNDDEKTVAAVDVLVPQVGEIVGGSQREERLEQLEDQVKFHNIDKSNIDWYCDIRRYGTVPHSGFGLGFARTLMYMSGMTNIRDVIPFPRTPKSAKF